MLTEIQCSCGTDTCTGTSPTFCGVQQVVNSGGPILVSSIPQCCLFLIFIFLFFCEDSNRCVQCPWKPLAFKTLSDDECQVVDEMSGIKI